MTNANLERDRARIDLAAALRLAARFELHEGIDNHFSYMLSDGSFLVNRWAVHWSRMRAADILHVDGDGTVLHGEGTVERTALHIHSQVHRTCPTARAILHTHMPYATALACTTSRLRMISQNALRFYGRVGYDDVYGGLANDASEGRRIAAALGTNTVVLMRHHGVLVTGRTIGLAFDDLYFLERTAMVQHLVASSGSDMTEIPADVARLAAEQIGLLDEDRETHFTVLKGLLDTEAPDYASL